MRTQFLCIQTLQFKAFEFLDFTDLLVGYNYPKILGTDMSCLADSLSTQLVTASLVTPMLCMQYICTYALSRMVALT